MDWPSDSAASLLDTIERTAKQRLKSKKPPRIAEDILESVQRVRNAMSGGDTEEIFATALGLGMDIGHAGYKEFGLREFLNRGGRPSNQNASRDQSMFEERCEKRHLQNVSHGPDDKDREQHVGRARSIEVITALAKKTKKPSAK